MANDENDMNPKTTIWEERNSGTVLLETMPGLPYGTPPKGQKVTTHKYGEAQCSGITKSGSGTNEKIIEIKITIK